MNFTFLKNQYTMVEYKGTLDVISKTFRLELDIKT